MSVPDVQSLRDDAIAIVDRVGLAWAIMGGCARNAYAEPPATALAASCKTGGQAGPLQSA